jgi:sortase A
MKSSGKFSKCISCRVRNFWDRARILWKWAEVALFLLGIVLVACYGAARLESYLSSRAALKAFESLDERPAAAVPSWLPENEIDAGDPDFTSWDANRVRAYNGTLWKRTGAPLAVVEIPKIHLAAPLMEGTDSLTLNHALGRIAGTAKPGEPGKIGIAGHRDSFFRGLKDVAPGDTIDLRTRDGSDIYVVDRIQIVTPREVSVLRPESRPSAVLVTCYPFYFAGSAPKRFVVTAYLTQHIPAGHPAQDARLDSQTSSSTPSKSTKEEQ